MIKYASDDIYKFFKKKYGKLCTKAQFSEVLKKYNTAFMTLAIEEGHKMSIGGTLGHIEVVKKNRRKRGELCLQPNFPESNRIKAEIIARGGTPYESYRDEDGIVIGNNGGEKWLVYYTDPYWFDIKWMRYKFAGKSHYLMEFDPGKLPKRELLPRFTTNNPEKAKLIYRHNDEKG